jgi:hypothetical protein
MSIPVVESILFITPILALAAILVSTPKAEPRKVEVRVGRGMRRPR